MSITPIRPRWKGTMTDRERFNRQMHYQSIDRCFNMEFGYWDENFTEWAMFRENGVKNNGQADIFFNFDTMGGIGTRGWMLPAFEERMIEETATTRIYINGDGLLAESPKDGHSSIPHYTTPTVVTPEDWQKVKEDRFILDDPRRKQNIEALKAAHPAARTYPLGIGCGSMIGKIRDMLSFEGLAYAMYDYPEMVEDMVETCCQLVERGLDELLPHFDFDFAEGWEDICFKNGPIVSVSFFRDIIMPRYKRIHTKLAARGIDLWYMDCDGDVRPILPFFLEGGVNCLFPFEVNGCAHPGELLDQYDGQLRIMGGIDKIEMAKGPEAITAYLKSVERLVARGGYIPFCDHRCPPSVSQENYLFYLDLKEKMFGMG